MDMAGGKGISLWKLFTGVTGWHISSVVGTADDVPLKFPDKGAVIIGTEKQPKWLMFDCPCGTGHFVKVTLDPANNPHWKVLQAKKLSVYPSIEVRTPDRHCHFMITNGNIVWVNSTK